MYFLGRHSFLKEVLDNHSDFKYLNFADVSPPSLLKVLYMHDGMVFTLPMSFKYRSNDRLTKILMQRISLKHIAPRPFFITPRTCRFVFVASCKKAFQLNAVNNELISLVLCVFKSNFFKYVS